MSVQNSCDDKRVREGGGGGGGGGREVERPGWREELTLSLGLSVLSMMSAASNSLIVWGMKLFLITITTSLGLGVADALYHGLRYKEYTHTVY